MKIDTADPTSHGKELWIVHDAHHWPIPFRAKLLAYSAKHELLHVGTAGPNVAIWGFSVYRRSPGFRTLGINVEEWAKHSSFEPLFFTTEAEALEWIGRATLGSATTPSQERL